MLLTPSVISSMIEFELRKTLIVIRSNHSRRERSKQINEPWTELEQFNGLQCFFIIILR